MHSLNTVLKPAPSGILGLSKRHGWFYNASPGSLSYIGWRANMRVAFILALVSILAGCSATPKASVFPHQSVAAQAQPVLSDPIDRLVASLSDSPTWMNGMFHGLSLPTTASSEQAIERALAQAEPNIGKVTSYKVLETREVHVGLMIRPFTAAHVQTNLGEKIILFQKTERGWWQQVYDV